MHIVAAQTGNGVLFTGMQIMKIAGSVTEAVPIRFFLCNKRPVMTLKTELFYRKTKLKFEIRCVRSMASKAVIFLDRRVHALLG
jgi:hypothetical protein